MVDDVEILLLISFLIQINNIANTYKCNINLHFAYSRLHHRLLECKFKIICFETAVETKLKSSEIHTAYIYSAHLTYCVKYVRIRNYSGPYFPVLGHNTGRYSASLRIRSKCGKIRTRITLNTDTLHAVINSSLRCYSVIITEVCLFISSVF